MLKKLRTSVREFRELYLSEKYERSKVPVMIFAGAVAVLFLVAYIAARFVPGIQAEDSLLKRTAQEGTTTRYEGRVPAGLAQVTVQGEFAPGNTVTVDVAVEGHWQSTGTVELGEGASGDVLFPVTIQWKSDTYTTQTYTGYINAEGELFNDWDEGAMSGAKAPHYYSDWYGPSSFVVFSNSPVPRWSSPEHLNEFDLADMAARAEVHRGVMQVYWMATAVLLPILALIVFAGEELARMRAGWYIRGEAEFSDWFYISQILSWVVLLGSYAFICATGLTQFV